MVKIVKPTKEELLVNPLINMSADALLEAYASAYEATNYWTHTQGETHSQTIISKEREETFKKEILRRMKGEK